MDWLKFVPNIICTHLLRGCWEAHFPPFLGRDPAHNFTTACDLPQVLNGSEDPSQPLPINDGTISINTQTFEGSMEVHLKGLPNTQSRIFEGKKRFFQIMVQVSLLKVSIA